MNVKDLVKSCRFTLVLFLSVGGFVLIGCASQSAAPDISGSQAPAPGSQTGIRSVTDTDYEQIALAVDTAQLKLAALTKEPNRDASDAVRAIADQTLQTLTPEVATIRKHLVVSGDAVVSDHNHAAVDDASIAAVGSKSGTAFDAAWARNMFVLNDQVIAAAVTELNLGEDPVTRQLARSKIDYASAQNAELKRIAGRG